MIIVFPEVEMEKNGLKKSFLKRTADYLEKISAACIVVALLQLDWKGFVFGSAALLASFVFTYLEVRN